VANGAGEEAGYWYRIVIEESLIPAIPAAEFPGQSLAFRGISR